MSLQWREQLSVANDLIDSDHKYLIDVINEAGQCLSSRQSVKLTAALDTLARYSKVHFAREELLAKAVGYPEAAQLQASHEALLTQLDATRRELGDTWSDVVAEQFSTLLRNWLITHVIKEDLLMKPYFQKHSPRFDPR